jgi:hypothetical protein
MREGKNCGKVIKVASRNKLLGTVHAPDEKAALKVAIKEVNIRPKGPESSDRRAELTMSALDIAIVPRRITVADLDETRHTYPAEVLADPERKTFYIGAGVICHFFGKPWYLAHIAQDEAGSMPDGYMRLDYSRSMLGLIKTTRFLDFAENLFNLQNIEGFDDRVNQMRTGDIEATFAEFDFGRFLYIHNIDFKFVTPCGVKGKDYDYKIRYADGRPVCADAKCRLEGTEMRGETIMNALRKARSNNLPPDEPGAVFVKVPSAWLDDNATRRAIVATVKDFLRNTQRVVTVVVYTVVMIQLEGQAMMLMRHRFQEFENPNHRFDRSKSWALFRDYKVPEEWGGMPPKWHRILSKGFLLRTN